MDIQIYKAQRIPNRLKMNRATPRHIIIKLWRVRDGKNSKSNKRKERSYLQGNPHKTIGKFSNRNFLGKEKMGLHIWDSERK